MRKSILAAAVAALVSPVAFAGNVTSTADMNLGGGIAGGYSYSNNTNSGTEAEFRVSDFIVELSGEPTEGVGFVGAFGSMSMSTIFDGGVTGAAAGGFGLQYGWLSLAAADGLTIDAGLLATNVGYEVAPTYANANILLGGVWNAQPAYYPGARATYDLGGINVYAEASADTTGGYLLSKNAWAVGVNGGDKISYAVNYFNYNATKAILDLIVSADLAGMSMGVNFDYQMLAEKPAGSNDDAGFGLAFYVAPSLGSIDLPVRVEYMSDGDSGIYGVNSGYSFTVTPTYKFGENAFVRAELAYVSADNKIFADEDGTAKSSKMAVGLQAGYNF